MNAEIVTIGTEIALGQITNTNAQFLADQLSRAGVEVRWQTTTDDEPSRIVQATRHALSRSDLVCVCGGLGPTADDTTMAAVADALGTSLALNDEHWQAIKQSLKPRIEDVPAENVRQAMYLKGGQWLPNPVGMALGALYEHNNQVVAVLPGPPREFKAMVTQELMPRLNKQYGTEKAIFSRTLHFFGRPESLLMDDLKPVMEKWPQVVITSYVQPLEIQVRLTIHGVNEMTAKQQLDGAQADIAKIETGAFFGAGEGITLAGAVVEMLKKRSLHITAAESLTAGMFQSTICTVPGASNIFDGGFVTYAAEQKEKMIGVPSATVDEHGVVSSATAAAMAEGCRDTVGADIGVGLTGVAGPDALEGQPAGTVWLGLAVKGQETQTKLLHLLAHNGRQSVREQAVQSALMMVYQSLK
ncbi:competence/damage-inducible protein A [Limosilactobacillus sp.]|uniref:competence/damage-inducible protein A n=1 Tax=Limosilactobacillus sp. TaxID=2773925 RepID=UPI00345EEEEB